MMVDFTSFFRVSRKKVSGDNGVVISVGAAVGETGVSLGGTGVSVGGTGVAVDAIDVNVGETELLVGDKFLGLQLINRTGNIRNMVHKASLLIIKQGCFVFIELFP
jgi:hypothetical protein